MAAIYLGTDLSGGLVLLPRVRWINGSDPAIPTDYSKQIDKASMLDGAARYHHREKHPRRWTLTWEMLTPAEFQELVGLNEALQALNFQNNWEDATWRLVVITDFQYTPLLRTGSVGCRYHVQMSLEEVKDG